MLGRILAVRGLSRGRRDLVDLGASSGRQRTQRIASDAQLGPRDPGTIILIIGVTLTYAEMRAKEMITTTPMLNQAL